jgi:hypothetical protein
VRGAPLSSTASVYVTAPRLLKGASLVALLAILLAIVASTCSCASGDAAHLSYHLSLTCRRKWCSASTDQQSVTATAVRFGHEHVVDCQGCIKLPRRCQTPVNCFCTCESST